jgi:hypothetical protein
VDIVEMNRQLINECTRLGDRAKLIYWMWMGWGTGGREENLRAIARDIKERSPEPWMMTVAWEGHWSIADDFELTDRVVYYPYGAIEPEPSLPFTTVIPAAVTSALDIPERIGQIKGTMGNAQTPLCQLPNIHFFAGALWNMQLRRSDRQASIKRLAKLLYPSIADLVARCWISLGSSDATDATELADQLREMVEKDQLGVPGPVGRKLFPDFAQVARDLAEQLHIHGLAMQFCRMADDTAVTNDEALDQLKAYCLASLTWRRRTGFKRFGTNGYNFFPLREAAHRRWWRDEQLDPEVHESLKTSMEADYEPWEAELILFPLNH